MFDNLSVFIVNSFVAHGEKEFGPPGKMAVNMESVSIFFNSMCGSVLISFCSRSVSSTEYQ